MKAEDRAALDELPQLAKDHIAGLEAQVARLSVENQSLREALEHAPKARTKAERPAGKAKPAPKPKPTTASKKSTGRNR